MNPIERHITLAVKLGNDFSLVCWSPHVAGLPEHVRESYPGPIKLRFDARYHNQSVGSVCDGVLTAHVSFSTLYTISIPLQAVIAFLLEQDVPAVLECPAKPAPARIQMPRTRLRLVSSDE